ncbi:MAG: RNA polymerase sigma factor [Mesorhizobium sp.]
MIELKQGKPDAATDEGELVQRAARRDSAAIRSIIKANNQRLYRLARAIVGNDADAEDVLQEAYIRAFGKLEEFRGDSSLTTWLSRITINQALMRLRGRRRQRRAAEDAQTQAQARIIPFPLATPAEDPERIMAQRQLLDLVEQATDDLPEQFRLVFIARVVEGLSVEETADTLSLPQATVKTRLHRARKLVREKLEARVGPVLMDAFPFAGKRCDRLTEAVLEKLGLTRA